MTPTRNSGAQSARGFTLLELLVVMALLGVAMLVAMGAVEPLVRAVRERGWVDRLQAELVRTRNFSRASGTVAMVSFLPEEGAIRFARGSQTSQLALPSGFRLETEASDEGRVWTLLFFPDGSASDVDIIFTGGAGSSTRLKVAGVSGRIEVSPLEPPG